MLPSKAQEKLFFSWAGTCRFIYNLCLEHRILCWNSVNRKSVHWIEQDRELKNLKKVEGFEWIKQAPAQLLQQTVKDLDKAFQSFFKLNFGFPKFKKKGYSDSFRFPDPKQFFIRRVTGNKAFIKLPKIGEVAFRMSRDIDGCIKNATIKRESTGWYISFSMEKELEIPVNTKPSVGIDRGISETLVLSTPIGAGLELTLPQKCNKIRERIKILQKRLRLKKKFSKKWQQLQNKIRKLHSKIARIRHDFLHKASNYIAKNHSYVTLEDLKIKNMSSSAKGNLEKPGTNVKAKSGLNREILFQGWGIFEIQLKYKCLWNGGRLEMINPMHTSTRCSRCLYNDRYNRKGKQFHCANCGYTEDADKNASINIDRVGRTQRDRGDVVTRPIFEAITSPLH